MLTIPNRTLVRRGSTAGKLDTETLESVRDYLLRLERLQDPQDFRRKLSDLRLSFTGGKMQASWLGSNEKFLFTDTGASQVAREVLPPRFYPGFRKLLKYGAEGSELATRVWNLFASSCTTPVLLRTVRMKHDNEITRVVRSCHSTSYAAYSNVNFVSDLLDHAGIYAKLPVLEWRVSDSGMRLRFAGMTEGVAIFAPLVPAMLETHPVPMIEAWNSEVGLRRVGLRAGIWRLSCGNALGTWDDRGEANWIHRGSSVRIRYGVTKAFELVQKEAEAVLEAYHEAGTIPVEDIMTWLRDQLSDKLSDRVLENTRKALDHPTTSPGSTLASAVDALTLAAQEETDLFVQYEVEQAAARVLHDTLKKIRKGRSASEAT
jgi:hypothetical protein